MNPVTAAQARALIFGGGIRLLWTNPTDATFNHVKILRKPTNTISGPTDPAATVIYTGKGARATDSPRQFTINPSPAIPDTRRRDILDRQSITWATTFYYAIFATNAGETVWSTAAPLTVITPEISAYEELDLIGVLLDYLDSYYKRQVAINALKLRPGQTGLDLHDAPPHIDNVNLPCVSIHLDDDQPTDFFLGDAMGQGDELGDPTVNRRGYISKQVVDVTIWTNNPEVRRPLYRMSKAALISARQVLERLGASNLVLTGSYAEDFENYNAPMYMGVFKLAAILTTSVREVPIEPAIAGVDVYEPALTAP